MKYKLAPTPIAILTLALAISIFFNFFLFHQGQNYYHQLNQTRLDPLGLNNYPAGINKSSNPGKLRVVFFGDSRAYQWPEPTGFERFEFINRGIGAQTSSQVVERFDEHINPLQPDVLLVQVCINDLKTIPLFPNLKSSIISNCKNNIKRIVLEAQKQEITVILTTVFPLGKLPLERRLFWSEDVARAIEEVNQFIISQTAEKVIIFDTCRTLANDKGMVKEEYSRDFLHLNKTGYETLNRGLESILKELEHTK